MVKKGWMVAINLVLLVALGCQKPGSVWPARDSYIVTTDGTFTIYVLDATGALLTSITPLRDSMQGIRYPTLVEGGERIAFLSAIKPGYPPYLCVTDQSGTELVVHGIVTAEELDGSPTSPELAFIISSETKPRIFVLDTDAKKTNVHILFSDTVIAQSAVGPIYFDQALEPAYSPDGSQVAFINIGRYVEGTIVLLRADIGLLNRDGTGYHLLTGQWAQALPPMASWLRVLWTHDARWVLAVQGAKTVEGIYAISVPDAARYYISRDYLKSYNYVCASPTGDTLILGTALPHADLYMVEYRDEYGEFKLGYQVSRLSDVSFYSEPDWGPGGK